MKSEFAEGSDTAYCSVGAIQNVTQNNYKLQDRVKDALASYLKKKLGAIVGIPSWNDAPERTVDEVREAFLMAAKDLRNGSGE